MATIADLLGVSLDASDEGEYRLGNHARRQSALKGFDISDVLLAANQPLHTYPNGRYPGQQRHVRNGIVAVVDPGDRVVVTVYEDQRETALRSYQRDADARAYGRRRQRALAHA